MQPKVYLVGGGPGDPELLTLKAARLLACADVVAYDDLLNPAILALCRPTAELIPVGYRGLRQGARSGQPGDPVLHPVVIERALAGKLVVRLKCGDPLVFGRGGEEALELKEKGLSYEFVPGITAALGAAAYAGIPLTHRGLAASVTLATGHLAAHMPSPALGFDRHQVEHGTIVFYMPRHELGRHLQTLTEKGIDPTTPAAFICAATTAAQQVVVGTVRDLAARVADFRTGAPGLVIIGRTVALRDELSWFAPGGVLAGKRVLLARARTGASKMAARMRELGAEVIEAPLLQAGPLGATGELDAALGELVTGQGDKDKRFEGEGDAGEMGVARAALAAGRDKGEFGAVALIFGCGEGVVAFAERLKALGVDSRRLAGVQIVAVGERAEAEVLALGWRPWRRLAGSCDEAVDALHGELQGMNRLVLIAGVAGRPGLEAALRRGGRPLSVVSAYTTRVVWPKIVAPPPDLVVLPSSTAAAAILEADLGAPLLSLSMVAIGPRTAATARSLGAVRVHMPARDEPDLVIDLVVGLLTQAVVANQGAEAQDQGTLYPHAVSSGVELV